MERFLQDKIGMNEMDRRKIQKSIFGENGLVCSVNLDVFQKRALETKKLVASLTSSSQVSRFEGYFSGSRGLLEVLQSGVVEPNLKHGVGCDWTNNNAESANHMLKSASQWKQLTLPKLVERLQDIIAMQEVDIAKAIQGLGNFKLAGNMAIYAVASRVWSNLTLKEKQEKILNFIRQKNRPKTNMVLSSNGKLLVQMTPSRGKKPNQNKRKRAEKSTTVTKKKTHS